MARVGGSGGSPPPPAPVAAVSMSGNGSPLSLIGSSSTGSITSRAWTQAANPAQVIPDFPIATADADVTFGGSGYAPGVYSFTLAVTGPGGSDSATTTKGWWDGSSFFTNPAASPPDSAAPASTSVDVTASTTAAGGSASIEVGLFADDATLTPSATQSATTGSPVVNFSSLTPETTYWFRQRSVDGVGASTDWSGTISATTTPV